MSGNDLDPHLIKCIGLMYESRKLKKGDPVPLQYILEEAIYQKFGLAKDYTDLFQNQLPSRESDESNIPTRMYEDEGNNSDNDLELDLFKDDLMCVICNKMDIGARNRLLECSDCHALYHQECHRPTVTDEDILDTWTCSNCKSVKKQKIEKEHSSSKNSTSKSTGSSSSNHKHGSSHKSSSDKYKSSSKSTSSSSKSNNASPSHSSSRSDDRKSSSSKSNKSSSKYSEKRKHD